MDHESKVQREPRGDGYDIGTFHFLKMGWWITHVIGIICVFYAGWFFGASY